MRFALVLIFLTIALGKDIYWVEYVNAKFVLKKGASHSSSALAWGYYDHDVQQDGWGKLYIWQSNQYSSHQFSLKTNFASGYLEGALTYEHIYNHYWSWYDYTFANESPSIQEPLKKWMLDQDAYTRQLIQDNPFDEYYQSLARITAQNDGLYKGIVDFAPSQYKITFVDLLYLQGCGDLYDIIPAVKPQKERLDWLNLTRERFEEEREIATSCSALIKPAEDWSDVWVAHTTWTSYQNMLRIYKYYSFTGPKPYRVSFAAKPGLLYSKDDFYVLPDQQLVVLETTNSLIDQTLFDKVIPQSLLTWQRVPIAHSLSTGGKEWTFNFLIHNSGTYNNQYMVVDMKLIKNKQPPTKDFIWISETMPGFARTNDVTSVFVAQSYWPSYNIPYDREVYEYAGFKAKEDDPHNQYAGCPRALLFKQKHEQVTSIEKMQWIIRNNEYKSDSASEGNPSYAIANRGDLNTAKPKAFGAIDAKISSLKLASQNKAWIQSGPSYDQQPVFSWSNWNQPSVHLGQPDTFKFGWILAQEPTILSQE